MPKNYKEIILGTAVVLLGFTCWWLLKLVFYNSNYFVNYWALIVGVFILFGIATCLAMLLIKNKYILFGSFGLSLLLFFVFLNNEAFYYLVFLIILFLAFLRASKKIKKEEDIQINLDFWRIWKRGLPILITALILVISIVYYFSPELMNKRQNKISISEKTMNAILRPLEGLIQEKFPSGISLDSDADKILLPEQKKELETKFGIKIEKGDTGRKVLYTIIDYQLNNVTGAYQYLIPLGLAIGLFITLKIASLLYIPIVIMLSWLVLKILIAIKFAGLEKIQKEVETVKL